MSAAAAAIELILAAVNAAGPVSAAIRKAHAENRKLTREELESAFEQDDAARLEQVAALERAKHKQP